MKGRSLILENVIGSFQLMESEEINTDAADIESVKAAAEQIYRQ